MKIGFFPMLALLMTTLNYRIDVLILKSYPQITSSQLGVYSIGISLADKIVLIPDTLKGILASKLSNKTNFILLAVGMAVIIIGFLLMTGPGSTEGYFEPDIFSVRRIKVAPLVCLFGFVFMIYGILRKPKNK